MSLLLSSVQCLSSRSVSLWEEQKGVSCCFPSSILVGHLRMSRIVCVIISFENRCCRRAWWCMPVLSAFRRGEEDHEFQNHTECHHETISALLPMASLSIWSKSKIHPRVDLVNYEIDTISWCLKFSVFKF